MSVVNIKNADEFTSAVIDAAQPVLVDFWAPWCGPCKMVGPEVQAVAEAYEGKAGVAKVNVDEQQNIASEYNVMSIPTMIIFKDGKEVNRLVGYRPQKDLTAALDKVL
ncbi:MAG: thioredoxin [Pelosinus sp.]|nr:thioredoxin [Pelosinus sp.]